MQVPLRPVLQAGGQLGAQATPRQSPAAGPGAFPSLARRLLPTAQVQCAKPPMRPGGVSPDDHLLPPPLYSLPSSSPSEKPITFLCVGAPWLFCSLNLGPCRRRGMIRNQHCQHFAPSLVQGRAVTLPTTLPHALLSFYHTQAARWTGYCCRRSQGTHPHLTDPCWDRGRLGTQRGQQVPALLLRCAGTCGRSTLWNDALSQFTKP